MANKLPFQTRDQFQSWVVDGRQDHVSLLTSRLLLRNVPHIGRVPDRETLDTSLQQAFAAAIFRNAMLCWTASTWGEPAIDEGQVLVSLRWAAGATEDFDPSYHPPDDFLVGSFLTRLATDSANSFLRDDPIECLFSAVDAAMKVGSDSFGTDSAVWNMIALDASLLDEGMASGKVAIMPLWPSGNPFWFDAAVRSMSAKLLALDNAWSELLAWYGARVTGGFMQGLGNNGERQIAQRLIAQDREWWAKLDAEPSAEIASWFMAERLRLNGQSHVGNTWETGETQLFLAQHGDETDAEVAQTNVVIQLHEGIKRRAAEFIPVAREIEDIHGWSRFAEKFQRFENAMDCPTAYVPDNLGQIYDVSIEIASFLDQDNDLRKEAWGNVSALNASRRRELENIVVSVGTWLRRFPTARAADDDAGSYLGMMPDKMLAARLVTEAGNQALISDADRKLLEDILSILETRGHLSEKAVRRGTHTVSNLVIAAVVVVGTFYVGAIESDFAGKSAIVQRAGDFLARTEATALEYIQGLSPDIRHSVEIVINRAKEQRSREPIAPVQSESKPEARKRREGK